MCPVLKGTAVQIKYLIKKHKPGFGGNSGAGSGSSSGGGEVGTAGTTSGTPNTECHRSCTNINKIKSKEPKIYE
jgi:hypothetical protein